MINLPASDDELLAQCDVDTFRSSGPGGQHVNKTETAVRLKHLPTGIVTASQTERSQYRNKQNCLHKLREKIAALNYKPPKRIKTKVPAAAKRRKAEAKNLQSIKKKLRSRPSEEE